MICKKSTDPSDCQENFNVIIYTRLCEDCSSGEEQNISHEAKSKPLCQPLSLILLKHFTWLISFSLLQMHYCKTLKIMSVFHVLKYVFHNSMKKIIVNLSNPLAQKCISVGQRWAYFYGDCTVHSAS